MNFKKLSLFVVFLLITGIIIIFGLLEYNSYLKNYFQKSENIQSQLNSLRKDEYRLNYLILKSTFYLYENNDYVMNEVNLINKKINTLEKNKFFKKNFPQSYEKFIGYTFGFNNKTSNIYRFFTYNSLIKNAVIYLDKILNSSVLLFANNKEFLQTEIYTIGNVLITKNSFDESFIQNLNLNYFKNKKFKDSKKEFTKNLLISNLILFKSSFPKYKYYLQKIQSAKTIFCLKNIFSEYYLERKRNIKNLGYVFYFIVFVLLGGFFIVSFLLYLIYNEHRKLQKSFITDFLTLLGNREKFNIDIKNYKNPIFYLINIDKFKHINDVYGSEIGDEILKKVALILKNNFNCVKKELYRLGGDDFGILCENELDYKKIIDYFRVHSIVVKGREFNIRISIGISKNYPLIETADMAIKRVKKDSKLISLVYNKSSNLKEEYEQNLAKSKILQNAIENDLIVPVFQPIFDNKTLEICKYEVLARIKTDDMLVSIYPYLKIAKENKIYKEITKTIYLKAYDVFKNNNAEFSLNLSIDDLLEEETMELIDDLMKDLNFAKRCTFELLESEAIEDYDVVKKFIRRMKKIGIKFAIDDFGSGYSNFEHIINLNIDLIKIDGSLTKKIEEKNTQLIIKTINDFSKKIGMQTIAEFVSNKKIFEKVKELNIDCTQGFYLSEPLEKI